MNDIARISTSLVSSMADDVLRKAEEAYRDQRRRCLDLEDAHKKQRTELEVHWGRKVSDMANDGAEVLRKLDEAHAATLAAERAKLETLGRVLRR